MDVVNGNLTAMLGDLGFAKDFSGRFVVENSSTGASNLWMAPEYHKNPSLLKSTRDGSGDIWSFGCTILEVSTPAPSSDELKGLDSIFRRYSPN